LTLSVFETFGFAAPALLDLPAYRETALDATVLQDAGSIDDGHGFGTGPAHLVRDQGGWIS
jgi:hypothetical protein